MRSIVYFEISTFFCISMEIASVSSTCEKNPPGPFREKEVEAAKLNLLVAGHDLLVDWSGECSNS